MTSASANFDKIWCKLFFKFFGKLLSCSNFMDFYEPVKLFKAWNRDIGHSLMTMKWFLKILISWTLAKTLLKFAIVFKIIEYFCPFLSLTIITGQQGFWSLAVGLLDITPETKINFELFHREIWKLFSWIFLFFCKFLKY